MAQFMFQNSESVKWHRVDAFLLEPTSMGDSSEVRVITSRLAWCLRADRRLWQSYTLLVTWQVFIGSKCRAHKLENRVQSPLSSAVEEFSKLASEKYHSCTLTPTVEGRCLVHSQVEGLNWIIYSFMNSLIY